MPSLFIFAAQMAWVHTEVIGSDAADELRVIRVWYNGFVASQEGLAMGTNQTRNQDRRAFLKGTTAAAAAVLTGVALPRSAGATNLPALPNNPRTQDAMPTRNLGKTGYKVGVFSLGGQAALEHPNNADVAVPIINRALDMGVNYIDTSSIYGGPLRWSEQYVGEVMKTRRNEAFLATKTKERTREGSMRMIDKSLELLHTDHVDLWQLHDIGSAVSGRDGALSSGCVDGGAASARFRLHFDGAERGRSASLHVPGAVAAAGGGKADGDYRDEGSGARADSDGL
jgi:hypothetical protein